MVPVPLATTAEVRVVHLDVKLLTRQQQETFGQLLRALNRSHAQTADGQHVDKAAHALRWLIEQIAAKRDETLGAHTEGT